jgi:excisionase family DNA binding protein
MPKEPRREQESRILTVRELAGYLHVDVSTIYRLVRKKELPAFRLGRDWRFKLEAIENWMRERQQQARNQIR